VLIYSLKGAGRHTIKIQKGEEVRSFQIKSSAQKLMAKARATANVALVDADIEEALDRLLLSLNTEAELNERGAVAIEQRLLRLLCNRLRMQRDFKLHPEINDQQIVRPLILTGGGRTGSTKLHKMLAASGDFLYLPFWQGYSLSLRTGDRSEDTAARIHDADEHTRWFDTHAPKAKLIHAYETFEPEEETLLLEHAFCGMYMMAYLFVPSFAGWCVPHLRKHLEFVKLSLKYLQWQFHEGDSRPWVLKCPIHFGNEPMLAQVFPDAAFVATHRNPLDTLSSTASLLEHYNVAYSDAARKSTYGLMMVEGLAASAQNFVTSREANPGLNAIDMAYPELTGNTDRIVEKVYRHASLQLAAAAIDNIHVWEANNRLHKRGAHEHSLAEYSITPEVIRGRFDAYTERFGRYF
jgi:Sulfotransferase family